MIAKITCTLQSLQYRQIRHSRNLTESHVQIAWPRTNRKIFSYKMSKLHTIVRVVCFCSAGVREHIQKQGYIRNCMIDLTKHNIDKTNSKRPDVKYKS